MGQPTDIDLPAGMVLTDSDLVSMGRYVDGDNVRWLRGRPQKIGGNTKLSPMAVNGVVRGACTYNTLSGRELIGAGTANALYSIPRPTYQPEDITPNDFMPGNQEPLPGRGWGVGTWGTGQWGVPHAQGVFPEDPLFWSVANFGALLLASPADGPLYLYNSAAVPSTKAQKVVAPYSFQPPRMRGFWITEERFVIGFGTTGPNGEPQSLMRLFNCAQGDYTDWRTVLTPQERNILLGAPAGSRQLQTGTRIMAGADLGSYVSLVWTDTAVYTHTYTGDSFTFNTQRVGTGCGLLARRAFALAGQAAYWVSADSFWVYSGGALSNIPAQDDVREWFFQQLRGDGYASKTFAFFNKAFNEIWFCFCTVEALEPVQAVVYSIDTQTWFKTRIALRSAQVSFQSQSNAPVLFGADGNTYQHESGLDDNGAPLLARLKTGLMEIASGATNVSGLGIMPDTERQVGTMTLIITALDRSRGAGLETQSRSFGPNDKIVDYRVGGREMALEFQSNVLGGDFRLGKPKFEIAQAGRRR